MTSARMYFLTLAKLLTALSFLVALGCGTVAIAQTAPAAPNSQTSPGARQSQTEIEREKSRVAAPAEQIRVILVKDPGLLVELERLVEREAISNGQLVEIPILQRKPSSSDSRTISLSARPRRVWCSITDICCPP